METSKIIYIDYFPEVEKFAQKLISLIRTLFFNKNIE